MQFRFAVFQNDLQFANCVALFLTLKIKTVIQAM